MYHALMKDLECPLPSMGPPCVCEYVDVVCVLVVTARQLKFYRQITVASKSITAGGGSDGGEGERRGGEVGVKTQKKLGHDNYY